MKTHTTELFRVINRLIEVSLLVAGHLLPSLLARFGSGGVLHASLSLCFDATEFVRLRRKHRVHTGVGLDCSPAGEVRRFAVLVLVGCPVAFCGSAYGQTVRPRITQNITSAERVTLTGSRQPMARTEQDGEVFYRPGQLVEFAARGIDVEVPWAGGLRKKVTGSSFAAPRVAGMLACLLSEVPRTSPLQAKALFHRLAQPWTRDLLAPNEQE